MHPSQKKGLKTLAATNLLVAILFFVPFILTRNFWFLTASLLNVLAMFVVIYLILKLNKFSKGNGQE
ncbi:hypothetical protein D9V84_05370 [Bacteroidetes/Chlorobi group bacterium Naka2016]|jgi:hypothetical protein|nr:MAG: hypothetical protein D9V84_05370 [Bacteroidetes/Chlorobi group bacterium Naka2016]